MSFLLSKERGFTLAEVLVAVTIIALLLVVALMSVQGVKRKGRDTQRLSDMDQIALALRMYKDSYGTYPPSAVDGNIGVLSILVPNFLPALPNDPLSTGGTPAWNGTVQNSYFYAVGPLLSCGTFEYTLWYHMEAKSNGTAESCVHLDNNSYTRHP